MSISEQNFTAFEVCISDGGSTDGRETEIINFLKKSNMWFGYQRQSKRCQYDENLRCAIALAQGRYVLLCGNDDALKDAETLEKLHGTIVSENNVGVVISNYEDWRSGEKTWRIPARGFKGSGPRVAATHYRNLSFVSGVLMDKDLSQGFSTDKWDGSEMYQMYIASRIIASGRNLLEIDTSVIRKDIWVAGETPGSYAQKPKAKLLWGSFVELPMLQIGSLVVDAVIPYTKEKEKAKIIEEVWRQLYCFTYPFWIVEYRRVQSWKYALCLAGSMAPWVRLSRADLTGWGHVRLITTYVLFSGLALVVPENLFERIKKLLYVIAKKTSANAMERI